MLVLIQERQNNIRRTLILLAPVTDARLVPDLNVLEARSSANAASLTPYTMLSAGVQLPEYFDASRRSESYLLNDTSAALQSGDSRVVGNLLDLS